MSEKTDRDPFNARYDRGDDDTSDEQANAESGATPDTSNSSNSPNPSKTSKTEETDKIKVRKETSNPSETEKTEEIEETTEEAETAESPETSGANESDDDLPPVRERQNINMYIADDDLVEDFKLRYQELNLRWRREYGEDLPKNDEFYPALLRSALNETTIAGELGLE